MKTIPVVIFLIIIAVGAWWVTNRDMIPSVEPTITLSSSPSGSQIACTQDAKLCPDGSYVGRTGPKCEFAPCPTGTSTTGILPYDSGVEGQVLLGPTCPVMRDSPDPQCADKAYQTTVQVIAVGSPKSSPFATVETDKEGRYKIMLPPGDYNVQPIGGRPFPACSSQTVTMKPGVVSKVDLACDTGIR